MKLSRIGLALAVVGLALFALAAGTGGQSQVEAAVTTVEVQLVGAQENPPVTGPGSGFARLTFDDQSRVLTYAVTISGISPDQVTAAHIHRGAVGVNGPIIYNLSTVGFTQVSGSITLTPADVEDLRAGNFYINAHSIANPGGFARGQIYLDPTPAIRASLNAAVAAWNRKDVNGFLNYFTEKGVQESFGVPSKAAAAAELPEFIGDPPISVRTLTNVVANGGVATGYLELNNGLSIEAEMDTFILEGGVWKIDGSEAVSPPVPSGTTTINVGLQDFAFVYDKSAITSGNIAFRATNTAKQDHELVLVKLNNNVPLLQLVQSEEDDPTIEFVGVLAPVPAGDTQTLVFTQTLASGRYGLVCFFPDVFDPAMTPHAFKGMISEFSIGGGGTSGGGGVRPPNTGDAGLLAGSSSNAALYFAGALTFLFGFGLIVADRRRA